jgi:methylated-DNA-[protein]-cysteine S-methyltransferase
MTSMSLVYTRVPSPIGPLLLAGSSTHLKHIYFETSSFVPPPEWQWVQDLPYPAGEQLSAYFAGKRRAFDLPLDPEGTPFQLEVWAALREIPYGHTLTYAELARRLGSPGAGRAIGLANSRNPLPIVIPCHRVVGAGGSLTGYTGGLAIKKALLELEGALLPEIGQLTFF